MYFIPPTDRLYLWLEEEKELKVDVFGDESQRFTEVQELRVSYRRWRPISPTREVPWGQDTSMYQTYYKLFITPVFSPSIYIFVSSHINLAFCCLWPHYRKHD